MGHWAKASLDKCSGSIGLGWGLQEELMGDSGDLVRSAHGELGTQLPPSRLRADTGKTGILVNKIMLGAGGERSCRALYTVLSVA